MFLEHIIMSKRVWFSYCMISWATSPCEIQHKQREPKTWDFFLRVQVPAVICVPVCISMALFKIAERIKTLSPLVGNSWQGTKHQVPFQVMPLTCPKTFTDVLCPAKLICSQILSAEAIQALGQGPPRPPPPPQLCTVPGTPQLYYNASPN